MDMLGWSLAIGSALLVGVIAVVLYLRRPPEEQELIYYRCKDCGKRLGYKKRQVGHQGMCPRCRHKFTFPPEMPAKK